MPFKIVPEPIDEDAFCKGDVAKISPEVNTASLQSLLFQRLRVLTPGVAARSADDPFNPVRAV